jgi:hypothetical protein
MRAVPADAKLTTRTPHFLAEEMDQTFDDHPCLIPARDTRPYGLLTGGIKSQCGLRCGGDHSPPRWR